MSNRLAIVVSTLNTIKESVTDMKNSAARASDQTITDSQRAGRFRDIKESFRQALLYQFHAKFNSMELFNINLDLREIVVHNFTNIYTLDSYDYKAQIGFDTVSTVDQNKMLSQDDTLKHDLTQPTLLHTKAEILIGLFQNHEQLYTI